MVSPLNCRLHGIHTVRKLEGTRKYIDYVKDQDGARVYHFNDYRRVRRSHIPNSDEESCHRQELVFAPLLEALVSQG
jgi:hypothetical protein